MQVSVLKEDGLNRELEVIIPAATIHQKVQAELINYSKTIRMDGFRKGKVPLEMVKKQHGQAVLSEVIDKALQESISKVMQDNNFRAASQPQIELGQGVALDENKDLSYKMKLEILPNVVPMDLSTITLEKPIAKVEESVVDENMTRAAEYYRASKDVEEDRISVLGDVCVIDFHGQTKSGSELPGMSGNDMAVELGSGRMIPGFEEQLVGHKVGEHVHVNVTFPQDYHAKELSGQEAIFHVNIKALKVPGEIKIDDEMAQKAGYDDLQQMRSSAVENIQRDYDHLTYLRMKRVLFDIMSDAHNFDLPASMVKSEYESILKQMEQEKAKENLTVTDVDREELKPIAERRVRLGLILAEIGRAQNIEVTNYELANEIYQRFGHMANNNMEQLYATLSKNQKLMDLIRAPLYEEKVVKYIFTQAQVQEKLITIEDLTKLVEDDEDQN